MRPMCLMHLEVLGWGGGSGRRRLEDLFFWVLLGAGGKAKEGGHRRVGRRRRKTKKGVFGHLALYPSVEDGVATLSSATDIWAGLARGL